MENEPIFEFYRCYNCKRATELQQLLKNHGCICGSNKVVPSRLTTFQLIAYLAFHPSLVRRIIRRG